MEKTKHSTWEYLKIIFLTDKRYIIVLFIESFASLFWVLAPLGLTGYILTIYNNDQEMNKYMVIIIVCAIYTMFRIIVSTITMYI